MKQPAGTLSGGEQRRLGLARILLNDAPILLLDEPTEGLDRETERQILRLILAHAENKTLIMVTHRLTAIEQFDELCVIDEAKLIEKGTYAELLQVLQTISGACVKQGRISWVEIFPAYSRHTEIPTLAAFFRT